MEATIQASASSTAKKRIPVTRRERWAWYAYDFGNSAYAAVVLMAVYSSYFKNVVVGGSEGSRLWGLSISIAMLVVSLTTPILGVVADFSRSKKTLSERLHRDCHRVHGGAVFCRCGKHLLRHGVLHPGGNWIPQRAGFL